MRTLSLLSSFLPPLQEERHQLQLHPPVCGDNGTLRPRDSKSRPGNVTPTMRVSCVRSRRSSIASTMHLQAKKKDRKERKKLLPAPEALLLFQGPVSLLTDRQSGGVPSRRFKLAGVDAASSELLKAKKKGKTPYRYMCIQF